jgi:hypothetical protein
MQGAAHVPENLFLSRLLFYTKEVLDSNMV